MTGRQTVSSQDPDMVGWIIGDYHIIRQIGSGAMSQVYLATQLSLDRQVALKILHSDLAQNTVNIRRFVQEAQAAAKLEHPNIVHIYEAGVFSEKDIRKARKTNARLFPKNYGKLFFHWSRRPVFTPLHFIAQEYVPGMNLQQYLHQQGPFTVRQIFIILQQIASALELAGQFGIVHRDIKPGNILLTESGRIKVVDFGLAYFQHVTTMDMSLTQTGVILGTPLYISPEQAKGQDIDFRSDIYSLGVTAYQMITGKFLFDGDTQLAVILQHLNTKPRPVTELRPEVPDELSNIIARMLEKKPQDRFNSWTELIDSLKTARTSYFSRLGTDPPELPACQEFNTQDDLPFNSETTENCFFDKTQDHAKFQQTVAISQLSMEIQSTLGNIRTLRQNYQIKGLITHHQRYWAVLFVVALLLGVSWTLFRYFQPVSPAEPPITESISRFDTVEQQWVFAIQLRTVDAWKSVIEYFPKDEYWTRRAQQQLACVYMKENNIFEAKKIFREFAEKSPSNPRFVSFGMAGLAWCYTMDGQISRASAILSDLRTGSDQHFDPITENIISRTLEIIRNKTRI
ncbi:MAG: serine/threonine protein kinase [Thermoguttaceae bacterium]|nr:serine/threonine protein kinase [Thermoguttaceae bacterium]